MTTVFKETPTPDGFGKFLSTRELGFIGPRDDTSGITESESSELEEEIEGIVR